MVNDSFNFNRDCLSKSYLQNAIFCNNSAGEFGGAVHLHNCNMTLSGSVMFVANNAQNGGGISKYFTSDPTVNSQNFIVFQESLNLSFYDNLAKKYGGALYINDIYLDARWCEYSSHHKERNQCFFTIIGLTSLIQIYFSGNQALIGGSGIYGGAIKYCKVSHKTHIGSTLLQDMLPINNLKMQHLYDNFDTIKVRFCECGDIPSLSRQSINKIIQRGQVFNISVIVVGEFDFPVSERVISALNYSHRKSSSQIFDQPYNYQNIEKGCQNLGFKILSELHAEQLLIRPPQCLFQSAILTVNIFLEDCPPGFVLSENVCACQETIYKVTGHKDLCNSSTGHIKCPQYD